MTAGPQLRTERVLLRRWRTADVDAFARINADARVMEFLPRPLARYESAALIARFETGFVRDGYGLWALELPGRASLAGFVGLAPVDPALPFAPAVEVGWRLAPAYWGRGFATEAAREVVRFAFQALGMTSLVSFTVAANNRSRRVMERLGMTRRAAEDFEHPQLPAGHPLARHVLYRLDAPAGEISSRRVRPLHQHSRA
jgi:RimJ/RimL family protein N-acetyltransferase